ncbi:MAG: dCTP deaminase domain-containing protein, partial [Elioraea tepidiphila]
MPIVRPAAPAMPAPAAPPAATASRTRLWSLVMEQVDPTLAAELPGERLRAELERLIHQIADKHRIELSAREQAALARDIADDMVGRLEGKSSLGRLGLLIHSTAGFVDAGWDGHLTL